jgi:hypothetical protein
MAAVVIATNPAFRTPEIGEAFLLLAASVRGCAAAVGTWFRALALSRTRVADKVRLRATSRRARAILPGATRARGVAVVFVAGARQGFRTIIDANAVLTDLAGQTLHRITRLIRGIADLT